MNNELLDDIPLESPFLTKSLDSAQTTVETAIMIQENIYLITMI